MELHAELRREIRLEAQRLLGEADDHLRQVRQLLETVEETVVERVQERLAS